MLKKSQSILEYLVVVTAIVVAVIAASEVFVKPTINKMFSDATSLIQDSTVQLKNLGAK